MADPKSAKANAAAAPYQVVARRFRPKAFAEVVGQEEVVRSLSSALEQKRIPHAFLFAGSRGVGKTTTARILARCLNCERGPTPNPCGKCSQCVATLEGRNTDVVEIDAASYRRIDDIRHVRDQAGVATMGAHYKVFILDEAHMLTKEACNALLKTLEEPPPHVVFVLATTELYKLPETIRSRCQVLQFRRIGEPEIVDRLRAIAAEEGVAIADEVIADIAASVRGGMRDAETALERALPMAREQGAKFDLAAWRALVSRVGADRTVEVTAALLQGDAATGLRFGRELQQNGHDEREALGELVETLRWLLLLKVDGPESSLVPVTGALRERLVRLAADAPLARLDAMIQAGVLGRERLRLLEDRGVVFEIALVRMAQAGTLPALADLLAEVRGGAAGAPASGAARSTASRASPAQQNAAQAPAPRLAATASDFRGRVLVAAEAQPMLRATLELCRFEAPDAQDRLMVVLDTDKNLHRDRFVSPPLQQQMTQFFAKALGRPVHATFRLVGAGSGAPGAAHPTSGAAGAPGATNAPRGASAASAAGAADAPATPSAAAGADAAKPKTAGGPREPGATTKRVVGRFGGRVVAVNPEDRVPKPRPTEQLGEPPDAAAPEPDETPPSDQPE